jgi:hypothetical protein
VSNVEYRFPLPVWLFALAGAGAVVLSIPAAVVGVRDHPDRTSRNLHRVLARFRLGPLAVALATVLLVAALLSGFFNPEVGFFNGAPLLFWIDLWVGVGIVSAFVGNVWDFASPLNAVGRLLDRVLARRGVAARAYPAALGVWPAVAFLLLLFWAELVWDEGQTPVVVASFVVGYIVVQLAAMAVFGAEVWLAREELFTVVARTFARLAPLEFYSTEADEPCRAGRCAPGGERTGCPSCWLAALASKRGIRLRPYGAGIRREPPLGVGGGAFVVTLLATVVYDALRNTVVVGEVEGFLIDLVPGLRQADDTLGTVTMIVLVGAFAVLFLAGTAAVAGSSVRVSARPRIATRRR